MATLQQEATPDRFELSAALDFGSQLVRIHVPLGRPAASVQPDNSSWCQLAALCSALEGSALPGVACLVRPSSDAAVQLVCRKSAAASVYRALLTQQAALGVRMPDVKGSVSVAPIPPDLQAALAAGAVLQALRAAGWHQVDADSGADMEEEDGGAAAGSLLLRSDFLSVPPGVSTTAAGARLSIALTTSRQLSLGVCNAGTYRFTPVGLLGGGLPAKRGMTSGDAAAPDKAGAAAAVAAAGDATATDARSICADLELLRRASRAMRQHVCVTLPSMRPSWVQGLSASSPGEAAMRAEAQLRCGYRMPAGPPAFYLSLAAEEGGDETTNVPCCCVWEAPGLTRVSEHRGGSSAAAVARQLVEDLVAAPGQLWGDGGLKLLTAAAAAAAVAAATTGTAAGQQASAVAAASGWAPAGSVSARQLPPAGSGTLLAPLATLTQPGLSSGGTEEPAVGLESASVAAAAWKARAKERSQHLAAERSAWEQLQPRLAALEDERGGAAGPSAAGLRQPEGGGAGGGVGGSEQPAAAAAARLPSAPVFKARPTSILGAARAMPVAAGATATAAGRRRGAGLTEAEAAGDAAGTAAAAGTGEGGASGMPLATVGAPGGMPGGVRAMPQLAKRKPGEGILQAAAKKAKGPPAVKKAAAVAGAGPGAAGAAGGAVAAKKPPAPRKPKAKAAAPEAGTASTAAPSAACAGNAAMASHLLALAPALGASMPPDGVSAAAGIASLNGDQDVSVVPSAAAAATPAAAATAAEAPVAAAGEAAAVAAAAAAARKRTKASDLDVVAVTAKARERVAAGRLGELSVPEMQCVLRSLRLTVGGKKAEVEARLLAALGGGGGGPAAVAVGVGSA